MNMGSNSSDLNHEHIEKMSDKIKAKNFAKELGLPIIPGSKKNIKTFSEAKNISKEIGYPVLIKASNGGGGRGIKKVTMKMI